MTYNSGQGLSNNELGQNKEEKEVLREESVSRDERQTPVKTFPHRYFPVALLQPIKYQIEAIFKEFGITEGVVLNISEGKCCWMIDVNLVPISPFSSNEPPKYCDTCHNPQQKS